MLIIVNIEEGRLVVMNLYLFMIKGLEENL